MRSQPQQENFSRTCWMTFQVRGVVSRLSVVSSLSLDIRPEIGRCSCAMRHWVVLSARKASSCQRMLEPGCYRCSSRPSSNHSPPRATDVRKAQEKRAFSRWA